MGVPGHRLSSCPSAKHPDASIGVIDGQVLCVRGNLIIYEDVELAMTGRGFGSQLPVVRGAKRGSNREGVGRVSPSVVAEDVTSRIPAKNDRL
jgi:hypothetical protein